MNHRKFSGIVEDCLLRIDRGEDFYDVLADYPRYQERLKTLLLVAMASRAFPMPVPSHTARRLGKIQMLEEMENLRAQGAFRKSPEIPTTARLASNLAGALRTSGYTRLAPSYRLAMLTLVLVMSGGYLTLSASASSQPGDMLYALKQGLERVQMVFMVPAAAEADLLPALDESSPAAEVIPPRTSGRSIWVINGIIFQVNQDDSPGVSVSAHALAEQSKPTPTEIQNKYGNRKGKADEEDGVASVMAGDQNPGSGQENPGKAVGKDKPKENQGKALGKDKPQENQGKSSK